MILLLGLRKDILGLYGDTGKEHGSYYVGFRVSGDPKECIL